MIRSKILGLAALAMLAWTGADAQRATEVYIPIGESPGVSGDESVIGTISSIDLAQHQLTISIAGGARVVTLSAKTRYYIDKNNDKQKNIAGSYEDCEVGRLIEAYVHDDGVAVWVKIAAPG